MEIVAEDVAGEEYCVEGESESRQGEGGRVAKRQLQCESTSVSCTLLFLPPETCIEEQESSCFP